MDESQPIGLFGRIPPDLLRPLTGRGGPAMWELLIHLNEALFSVDAMGGNGDGYIKRRVTGEIENYLLDRVDWLGDDDDDQLSTVSDRTAALYARLVACGWLKPHTIGARVFVVMPPLVQRLLELLVKFAEDGAQFVSGRVQSIYIALQTIAGKAEFGANDAALLATVARDSRDLMSSLANTSVRIRDVLDLLRHEDVTSRYVKRFFKDYVSDLYIKDYRDLRTENHPMRHRNDIVAMADGLKLDTQRRASMIRAYKAERNLRGLDRAEQLFEKDLSFILRFRQVEEYLDRLDDNVNRATRAALATLSYRLRTPSNLAQQLQFAAEAVAAAPDDAVIVWPLMQGPLFGAERLREPSVPYVEPSISKIVRRKASPEQRAYGEMRRSMVRARQVNAGQVRRYRDAFLPPGKPVEGASLPIHSVDDLIMVMAMSRASFLKRSMSAARQKDEPLLRAMRGLEISASGSAGEILIGGHLRVPSFVVTREG